MRKLKKMYKWLLVSVAFVILISFTVQVDFQFPITDDTIKIEMNEVKAGDPGDLYDDAELAYQTCWVTGRQFLKCVHGDYVCDVSDQGYCGGGSE